MKKIAFDPTRLLALARRRDEARALSSAAGEKYQALREKRMDVLRRAATAGTLADDYPGQGREVAQDRVAALHREAEALRQQMDDVQADIDAKTSDAAAAGALLKSATQFALNEGLQIPAELSDFARVVRGEIHPTGIAVKGA